MGSSSASRSGVAAIVLLSACAAARSAPSTPTGRPAASAPATSSAAPPAASSSASAVPSAERTLAGENFDVVWTSATATDDDAKRSLERAETARAKFIELLGKDRVNKQRRRIRLAGDGSPRQIPHVEPDSGDIVLYRFPGDGGAYEAPLAHELVHAIRLASWTKKERQTDPGLFWEEGFAELIAREAGFPSLGFPLYGFSPEVGAASFTARGESLPIPKLVAEHRALNFRCMAQAYVERISFMTYLRKRLGLEPMIAVANIDAPLDVPTIEKTLHGKLADLASAHDKDIAAFAARPESRETATRFRDTTPIRYLPVCPVAESGPVSK